MIGYRVSRRELRRQITAENPDWLSKAERGEEPAWGDIKGVFVRIQHFKCGYCERPMPRPQRRPGAGDAERWGGRREYDVEHFRPKGAVKCWPDARSGFQYDFDTGDAMAGGYSWLSHDCFNYLVSCKTCNQDNKKDYFPIAGHRGEAGAGVRRLDDLERPYLVNPVGTGDVKPEDLIGFHGVLATPRGTRGHKRRRGTIIIDFFGLNLRDDLILERCYLVTAMWHCLERHRTGDPRVAERVSHGIHYIPLPDIERRFVRSLDRLFDDFGTLVDRAVCFSNVGPAPRLVFTQEGDHRVVTEPSILRMLEDNRRHGSTR